MNYLNYQDRDRVKLKLVTVLKALNLSIINYFKADEQMKSNLSFCW